MSLVPSIILRAITAAVGACALIFLAAVAAGAVAWSTESRVYLPMVIDVRVEQENGLPAVLFEPQFRGMLLLVLAAVILSVVFSLLRARRATMPHA